MIDEIIRFLESKGFTSQKHKTKDHFTSYNYNVNGRYHIDVQGSYCANGKIYIVDVRLIGIKHVEYEECFDGYEEGEENAEQIYKNI